MNSNQDGLEKSKDVEIRMLFERASDSKIIVERIHVSKDTPQSQVCDAILFAWGQNPNIDDISFILAQTDEGSVIVTKPDLLKYVENYRHLYA